MTDAPDYTCKDLKQAFALETDPAKKIELSRDYNRHCLIDGDQKPPRPVVTP